MSAFKINSFKSFDLTVGRYNFMPPVRVIGTGFGITLYGIVWKNK